MTEINLEMYDWVIWFSNDERDYVLNGDVSIAPVINKIKNRYRAYNQSKQDKTKKDCTLYWPITSLSNLNEHKFSDKEIMQIVEKSRQLGKPEDWGWRISLWVKTACERWNANNPDRPVMYFQTNKRSDEYYEAMEKGHFLVVGINYNNDFIIKTRMNGEFRENNLIWNKTWGHCLCNTEGGDGYKKAVDNYNINDVKGHSETKEPDPSNEYRVFDNVFRGNVYQPSGFIILAKPIDNKKEMERLTSFKEVIIKSILANKEEWHRIEELKILSNDKDYLKELDRMQNSLNKFNNLHRDKLRTIITMLNENKKDYEYLK